MASIILTVQLLAAEGEKLRLRRELNVPGAESSILLNYRQRCADMEAEIAQLKVDVDYWRRQALTWQAEDEQRKTVSPSALEIANLQLQAAAFRVSRLCADLERGKSHMPPGEPA